MTTVQETWNEAAAAQPQPGPEAPVQAAKREWTPEQIMAKNVRTMPNRQMVNRLRRLARNTGANMDGAWASVLFAVLSNTKQTGGRMEPYLR